MRFATTLLLACCMSFAHAAVYKIVNPDGSITYSDRPQEGAETVEVREVQTIDAPENLQPIVTEEDDAAFPEYDVFEVAQPEDDETFRDNGGFVSIQLSLKPGLFRDHTIAIFMDGKDLGGSGRGTSVTLQNVDRGSHTVHAVIRDSAGKEVKRTPGVTFHLHRTSVQN